jgi:protein-S-isoprenylcysteine O-methyltransferase Ste14
MTMAKGVFSAYSPQTLGWRAALGILVSTTTRGVLLFTSAGAFGYWQAWANLAIFATSISLITVFLWKTDQKLLARRLIAGPAAEKQGDQKIVQRLTAIGLIILLIIAGLDHRFGLSATSIWMFVLGNAAIFTGQLVIVLVFRENSFASSTVEIFEDQRVIVTGPYSLIRHPMYFGMLVVTFGTPAALGSFYALIPCFGVALFTVARLLSEERLLLKSLSEYGAYCRHVRYRLVPYIW